MESEFYVSTDRQKLDVEMIWDFLCNRSYWAKGRSKEVVYKSIDNSMCFGLYTSNGDKQAGFARVVSDHALFAWVLDVFVLEEYRGKGLGKLLMINIMSHTELYKVRRWGLATRDAHKLYERFGFSQLANPENMMELIH